MIGAYMFENKSPTKAESNAFKYFSICKRKLDESKQRMQNGAKGGRPKKNKNRRKRAVYPKSATRLHGKRTETIHKPTTEKAPCKGERDT